MDIDLPDTYVAKLEALNPTPYRNSTEDWGRVIGFGCDPSSLLDGDLGSIFRFEVSPWTGQGVKLLDQPKAQYGDYDIAHGANPALIIPVMFWSDWALDNFLTERGLRLRGRFDRENAIRLAKRVLSLMKELESRAPQPREWKEGAQTAYDEEEQLCLRDQGGKFNWVSDWDDFTTALYEMNPISDDDFFKSFGTGRNGIQTRSKRLIAGGHFNLGKIQSASCKLKTNNNPALAIRMECVPSMKAEAYWAMFVIDITTKQFVPAPTSRCGCPAGLGGCSHLRAQYAIFSLLQRVINQRAQQSEYLTQEEAVALFPPSIQNMRKIPIPFSYAFHDDDADQELKKMKRAKEHGRRQRLSQLNDVITQLNSGDGITSESEDSDSFASWSGGSGLSDNESVSDSYCSSDEDSSGDDVYVDLEEDVLDDEEIDDIVDINQNTSALGQSDIKLCEFVYDTINTAAARAQLSGSNTKRSDYKMERGHVFDYLRGLLDGKLGPNESVQSKIRQLTRQHLLHKHFEAGDVQKCLLSHYLYHTEEQRRVSL